MSALSYACDHNKHHECGVRLGAVSMLNGKTAVIICDCPCHAEPQDRGSER